MMGKSKKLSWDRNGNGFQIMINITSNNQKFTLPLVNPTTMGVGTGYNFIVDWGDGSTKSTITAYNQSSIVHKYSTRGYYIVHIQGQCDGWSFNNTGSKALVYKILNWGDYTFKGFGYLYNGFYGCSNIISMPSTGSIKQRLPLIDMSSCFRACSKLTNISNGLFDKLVNTTTFYMCFYGCAVLTAMPSNLFMFNSLVLNYSYTFYGCNRLQIRSDIFDFNNFLNKAMNFSYLFYRTSFTGTKGTAPELWGYGYNVAITSYRCFYGSGNSTTSLTNFTSIPTAWK